MDKRINFKRNIILELIVIAILITLIVVTFRSTAASSTLKLDAVRDINFTTEEMMLENLVLTNSTGCNLYWSTSDTDIINIISATGAPNPIVVNIKMKKPGTAKITAKAINSNNKVVAEASTTLTILSASEEKVKTTEQVNLRDKPNGRIVQKDVPGGTELTRLQKGINGTQWDMVRLANGTTGVMHTSYLTPISNNNPSTPSGDTTTGERVKTTDTVNLRKTANGTIIKELPAGKELIRLEKGSNKWDKVNVDGTIGYIYTNYLMPVSDNNIPSGVAFASGTPVEIASSRGFISGHSAVDLTVTASLMPDGAYIIAAYDGEVVAIQYDGYHCDSNDSGIHTIYVTLKHSYNGTTYYTRYYHLKKNGYTDSLKKGDTVYRGQIIGIMGDTGYCVGSKYTGTDGYTYIGRHLDFKVYKGTYKNGNEINPYDLISTSNPRQEGFWYPVGSKNITN